MISYTPIIPNWLLPPPFSHFLSILHCLNWQWSTNCSTCYFSEDNQEIFGKLYKGSYWRLYHMSAQNYFHITNIKDSILKPDYELSTDWEIPSYLRVQNEIWLLIPRTLNHIFFDIRSLTQGIPNVDDVLTEWVLLRTQRYNFLLNGSVASQRSRNSYPLLLAPFKTESILYLAGWLEISQDKWTVS